MYKVGSKFDLLLKLDFGFVLTGQQPALLRRAISTNWKVNMALYL
jgi:hypothetical protein